MEKKLFFLIFVMVLLLVSGCASLERSATVTMLSPATSTTVASEKSVEIQILTETPEFTVEDESLFRCLVIAGLQERGLQTPVSTEKAAECNNLFSRNIYVKYFWKKMGFTSFECKPQVPSADTKPLLLNVRVLEIKKNNRFAHLLVGGLAGRPQIKFEISAGKLRAEIEAKAPISGHGGDAFFQGLKSNFPQQAIAEGVDKTLKTILSK